MKISWRRVLLVLLVIALFVGVAWASFSLFSRARGSAPAVVGDSDSQTDSSAQLSTTSEEEETPATAAATRQSARNRVAARLQAALHPAVRLALPTPAPALTEEEILKKLSHHAVHSRAQHARARFGRRTSQRTSEATESAQSSALKASVEDDNEEQAAAVTLKPAPPRQTNPAGAMPDMTDAAPVSVVIVATNEVLLPKTVTSILSAKSAELINGMIVYFFLS